MRMLQAFRFSKSLWIWLRRDWVWIFANAHPPILCLCCLTFFFLFFSYSLFFYDIISYPSSSTCSQPGSDSSLNLPVHPTDQATRLTEMDIWWGSPHTHYQFDPSWPHPHFLVSQIKQLANIGFKFLEQPEAMDYASALSAWLQVYIPFDLPKITNS